MTETRIYLTPTTSARMELVALEPSGPFRLIVDHPAAHLVEYFRTSADALARWAQIETVLSGVHADDDDALPPAA